MATNFADLTRKLLEDESCLDQLPIEDVMKLKSTLAPSGDIRTDRDEYAVISVVNASERYAKKLLMTSMIGFVYRLLEEYEASAADKNTIRTFLDRNFEYDPDRHVRVAHNSNKGDPERKGRDELIRGRCKNAAKSAENDKKLAQKGDAAVEFIKESALKLKSAADNCSTSLVSAAGAILAGREINQESLAIMLSKSAVGLRAMAAEMGRITGPVSAAETLAGLQKQPPADTFYNFTRYYENNYELLRETTTALFADKPDIEFSINFYGTFKSEGTAKAFCDQHNSEFKVEPYIISNKGMYLLGPWKQNRDRIAYYDKNKEVLKALLDQQESDSKLGADLMKKTVTKKKKKNIEEAGPDAPGLADYISSMNIVKELSGADRVLSAEDKKKLAEEAEKARKIKESYEVPDDAIQVDVFKPTDDGKLERVIAYTQAEKPLHMQPDDPHAHEYQPVRGDVPMEAAYDVVYNGRESRIVIDKTASSAYSSSQ